MPEPSRPTPITRIRDGRWLAGVCRGVAEARELETAWLRLGFVALALLGGIGVALYVACWLIMPTQAESEGEAGGARGAVWFAQALGVCVGLLALAVLGATGTVFGFGWVVFAVAGALLVVVLGVRRLGPGWALLPVAALALPSVAVAAGGLSLTTRTAPSRVEVMSVAALEHHVYRSGLNTMLLDLRHTPLPARGNLTVRIRAGLRRTIVALPHDACVRVRVNSHINPFPLRMASLLSGRSDHAYADLFMFGRLFAARTRPSISATPANTAGPTLTVDFSSEGGSLYVRDYPDTVNPDAEPDWPGYPIQIERAPSTAGLSKRLARYEVSSWRHRQRLELSQAAEINDLRPGPCVKP